MSRINLNDIKTEKDLQLILRGLDCRWQAARDIKDYRKRCKEIIKLRSEVKYMLNMFKGLSRSANFNDNNGNLWNKMFKNTASWLRVIERKYKDV